MQKPNSAKYWQDTSAARKSKSTCHECKVQVNVSRMWTTWSSGLVIPDALERETKIYLLGQTIKCSHIVKTSRTLMMDDPSLRELSVCSNFVSNLKYFVFDAHIPVSLVLIGTVLSAH